jgi:hypothetical protein
MRIQSPQFVEALRLRLLMQPLHPMEVFGKTWNCKCGRRVDLDVDPRHLLDCESGGWYITRRHDDVRDLLCDTIRRIRPEATITLEPVLTQGLGNPRRGDIKVILGNRIRVIDVAICDPSAACYRDYGSIREDGAAAKQKERQKEAKYADIPDLLNTDAFVPFVVEATGRIGPKAFAFLEQLMGPNNTADLTSFTIQVGAVVNRFNGRQVGALRQSLEQGTSLQ